LAFGNRLGTYGGRNLLRIEKNRQPKTSVSRFAFGGLFYSLVNPRPVGTHQCPSVDERFGGSPIRMDCLSRPFGSPFFQAIFFQFGGLTVLGVNTFNMAFPAVLAFYITKPLRGKLDKPIYLVLTAVIAATVAVFGAGILVAVELYLTGEAFRETAELVILAHIPVAIIEAIVYTFVLFYLKRINFRIF
jgi:hypothetical protein